jgi:hypothetical protein
VEVEPDEIKAVDGEGWRRIGEEISERIAFRPACYFRLVLVRGKWVRVDVPAPTAEGEPQAAESEQPAAYIVIAPTPESLWPRVMADPSAIANVIMGKYGDVLPLNRQETISVRQGWALPRSTQCEWLGAAYDVCHRVVEAMLAEARARAFCGLEVDRERALEALALISRLFKVDRECRELPMPERTAVRAARAGPVLELFDTWIEKQREMVDPRGPLDAAIGYYDNQRVALRRFLEDGRLRLDNNVSEAQLRNVVLGRHNWKWFANETGLEWYATFRSLIASCALHGLNAQTYLEHLLRLAPHWPVTRQLELSPKYWARTIATLDDRARAIVAPSWGQPLETTCGSLKAVVTQAA